ncbi:hypothetical protein D9M70_636430 [compost metagenome]
MAATPWPVTNSDWLNSVKVPPSAPLLRGFSGPYSCVRISPARSKPQLLMYGAAVVLQAPP